ncbi:alpha,alpha-trehalose-phosphate synthase (UDP-forming) [Aestuariivirga sp. YIM B02566]|uniref:Trehalose-6-phosphate synthase n=1 Tax=Taklimakanibacter albus TaxID=2800327 RepID=A0ACC5RBI8_9HYPH|nr:trehalose-6-phosphate synthase [Aestuariivirga sp. YIM B02566]MBK1870035.1 trehalose-6-phosphate synthase [Aestuariivirga sp. YIM B02566]
MARLVIVSNRVPVPAKKREQQAGGLAVVLEEALKGDVLWFGWSGRRSAEASAEPVFATRGSTTFATIDLSEADYRDYYAGFANRSLWPLLHYRTGLVAFLRDEYQGYRATNRKFAAALMPLLRPDDIIWIHDYHLIPLGHYLRELGCRQKIGFFLHIPFPPLSVFDILPPARELIGDLATYDVVGFQTHEDRDNFQGCAGRLLAGEQRAHAVSASVAIPVGIDGKAFAQMAKTSRMTAESHRLKHSLVGRKLIIGADRLDYSKGLPQRFEAYSELLETHAQYREKVSFLQIAPRSREDVSEYRDLKRSLDRLTGKINGKFAEFDWVPLRYMTHGLSRKLLAGFFRMAAIGLVTPLRDGMNLVAMEYIAAQDPEDPGVLVLSRFAGAAASLDAALVVNPFDTSAVAEAIHQGLMMPKEERRARWLSLMDRIEQDSAASWCRRFLARLSDTKLRAVS